MFIDHIRIHAKAGKGGNGSLSFMRAKYIPKGGPDGGDGGNGGSIILRVNPHIDNLKSFFYQPHLQAPNGKHGKGKQMHGKSAKNTIATVPPGTLVYRQPVGASHTQDLPDTPHDDRGDDLPESQAWPIPKELSPSSKLELVADLVHPGQEFILCRGGKGGRGNVHFKTATNQAPRMAEPGEDGEEGYFYLELRQIADVGLIGYPNAGKSTLISAISSARPKVAAYPFTTLRPVVGVLEASDYRRATVADIPGLIEGAHRNVGLGHDFLRHITRCQVFFFVIDMAGSEGRDPAEDLTILRREIDLYDVALSQRPWLVLANKMDLPDAKENLAQFQACYPSVECLEISAACGEGLDALKARLFELLPDTYLLRQS